MRSRRGGVLPSSLFPSTGFLSTCRGRLACVWLALCLVPACDSHEETSRELYELERLAFVPEARFKLVALGDPNADCSMKQAIVIDLFEFTERDRRHYAEQLELGSMSVAGSDTQAVAEGAAASPAGDMPEDRLLDRPAPMSFHQAERMAAARDMRIPRAKEWVHVAVGRKKLRYPWGAKPGRFANTKEIGLERAVRVGTFENGRVELFGCYDMLGNVWEWVADEAPSYYPQFELSDGDVTSVMGGGFDSDLDSIYGSIHQRLCFYARTLPKDTQDPAYGARMCADAAEYLWDKARAWGRGPEVRTRVSAVGRRWAKDDFARDDLKGILDELLLRPGAPEGLRWLQEGVAEVEGS